VKGEADSGDKKTAILMSYLISLIIIFFNKFVLGKVFHLITDLEKNDTKSKFQISFAYKLAIALFLNSAIITYIVEIIGS
jgi:hypothetical protein